MKPINEYIVSLENVLSPHFAPEGLYAGAEGALRLAREVGVGLAPYPDKDIRNIAGALFGRLVVKFCFHSRGVPMDSKPWIKEMRKAIRSERRRIKERQREPNP